MKLDFLYRIHLESTNAKKKVLSIKILATSDYFLPAFRSGGSVRTLANMVEQLGDSLDFHIITRDRDLGDSEPYKSIEIEQWQPVSKGKVYYCSPASSSIRVLCNIIRNVTYDILYLNSAFSPEFTINVLLYRYFGLIETKPVIIAPRGEFAPGALRLKNLKKKWFLLVARMLGLYRKVIWQASSEQEARDIQNIFGQVPIFIAPDLRAQFKDRVIYRKKLSGELKIIFLSRIAPVKNLLGALAILEKIQGKISFDIYGPLEDKMYWLQCEKAIRLLPPNIKVQYHGDIHNEQVVDCVANYHLFFLPTLGENFGHVIHEALLAGCPVVISDTTPWNKLEERRIGYDLPLDQPLVFAAAINSFVQMNQLQYDEWSIRAKNYGIACSDDESIIMKNIELFSHAYNTK